MIAVVGYGAWGRNLARNFEALGRLGAIVDIAPLALSAARTAALGVPIVSSIDAALVDARISAVAIATPAETHVALCHQALDRGLDVFCEKPLALVYAHAERVARRAEDERRVLMVGHILEYHPGVRALLALVEDGVLGEVQHIQTSRLHPDSGRSERDALWALAPHDVAVILRLTGRLPIHVVAEGTVEVARGVLGDVALHLRFSGGLAARVHLSSVHSVKEQRIVVVGSQQTAVFDDVADRLTIHDTLHHTLHERSADNHAMKAGRFGAESRRIEFSSDEPLRLECAAFIDALSTRRPPRTDARSALEVLRVIEQAQMSILADGRRFASAANA